MTIFASNQTNIVKKNITYNDIKLYLSNNNIDKIADAVYDRIYFRYLNQLNYGENDINFRKQFKSGFVITTISCIVIEIISQFITGVNDTIKPGDTQINEVFKFKFSNNTVNPLLELDGKNLYRNIRNGLMHQGETKGSFKISRKIESYICDDSQKIINANNLFNATKEFLKLYVKEVKEVNEKDPIRVKFIDKVKFILANE